MTLSAQEENLNLPVYGSGGLVDGTVQLIKTDAVNSVEVKVRSLALLRVSTCLLDMRIRWREDSD